MADSGPVAIGRFVMRTKEHLAAIRADGPLLSLAAMRFHDELRDPVQAGAPSGRTARPRAAELRAAVALIESPATDFDPARWRDRHRARLRRIVARKAEVKTIRAPREEPEPEASPDLMAALEASIARLEPAGAR